MAAPVIQSSTNAASGSAGTSGSANKPTGVAVGDLLLAIVTARNDVTSITPGITWDVVESNITGSGSTYAVFKRIADGTEGSSFSFSFSVSTRWCIGILRIDGHDPTTPINVSAESIVASGGVYNTPSVTTTVADCLIVRSAHHMRGNSSFNAWGSGTELWDISGGSLTLGCIQTVAYMTAASAGATGTVQVTATSSDVTGAGVTIAIAPTPAAAVEKDLILDYAIALQKDVVVLYDVLAALDKDLVLLYDVAPKATKDLILDYAIQLYKDLGLRWKLENAPNLYYDYHIIRQGTSVLFDSNFGNTVARPVLSAQPAVSTGLVIPDVTPLPAAVGSEYLYFYADYYLRIWLDPNVRRLSNPRLNTPYSFSVWNAFPNQNYLVEAIKTDLTGVTLVDTVPVLFERYEYKTLSFEIDSTAPASLDGTFEFVFDYGDALLRIIATVVEVTRLVPNEPVTELWVWKTTVTIAEDGSEQRAALRNQPRYRLNCTVNIKDEEDRLVRYNQLWAFLSRDIRMPFFQYMTPLLADASIGDTVLSIDTSATDLRANEYASLYDPNDGTMAIVKVVTVGPDYVVLETGIDVDVTDEWSIVPTVAMRMPDGTGIRMAAVNGVASISAESVQYRDLVRDAGAASVTTFDGYPVLTLRPIAVEDLVENFSQGSGVVDNETALPQLYSFWSTPFVNGSRQWKIERSDVDFWRIFMDEVKGMLNPFLLPTFRNDLPIYTMPALSSNKIEITNVDYAAQWENDTYKRIQIESDNGVVYRKVTSFVDPGNGRLELTLDSPIGSNPGDNNIIRISHLNKVRLASDTVTLEHYVNWTIVSIDVRTINT